MPAQAVIVSLDLSAEPGGLSSSILGSSRPVWLPQGHTNGEDRSAPELKLQLSDDRVKACPGGGEVTCAKFVLLQSILRLPRRRLVPHRVGRVLRSHNSNLWWLL